MTMVLLTVIGLVIAGMLTGAFPAAGAAWHRRQRGQGLVERRPASWRPAPRRPAPRGQWRPDHRTQASRHRFGSPPTRGTAPRPGMRSQVSRFR